VIGIRRGVYAVRVRRNARAMGNRLRVDCARVAPMPSRLRSALRSFAAPHEMRAMRSKKNLLLSSDRLVRRGAHAIALSVFDRNAEHVAARQDSDDTEAIEHRHAAHAAHAHQVDAIDEMDVLADADRWPRHHVGDRDHVEG
jgi:hypothetical protein